MSIAVTFSRSDSTRDIILQNAIFLFLDDAKISNEVENEELFDPDVYADYELGAYDDLQPSGKCFF